MSLPGRADSGPRIGAEIRSVSANAEPAIACAADALHSVLEPDHVRVLMAVTGQAEVFDLHVLALIPALPRGVS